MIDLHLVVQGEGVIALAPVVTNPGMAVDHQRVHVQLREPRSNRQAGLPAADYQYRGVPVFVGHCGLAQVEPVGAAKVSGVGVACRPCFAHVLFEAAQALAAPSTASMPSACRLSAGSGMRRTTPSPRPSAVSKEKKASVASVPARVTLRGGCPLPARPEARRPDPRGPRRQCCGDTLRAADGRDQPGEGQHVAPVAVGVKDRREAVGIDSRERALEVREPLVDLNREIFVRHIQHDRATGNFRRVSVTSRAGRSQAHSERG